MCTDFQFLFLFFFSNFLCFSLGAHRLHNVQLKGKLYNSNKRNDCPFSYSLHKYNNIYLISSLFSLPSLNRADPNDIISHHQIVVITHIGYVIVLNFVSYVECQPSPGKYF